MPQKNNLKHSGSRTTTTRQALVPMQNKRMASNGVPVEQKKSYGIGGAGNIRMYALLLNMTLRI